MFNFDCSILKFSGIHHWLWKESYHTDGKLSLRANLLDAVRNFYLKIEHYIIIIYYVLSFKYFVCTIDKWTYPYFDLYFLYIERNSRTSISVSIVTSKLDLRDIYPSLPDIASFYHASIFKICCHRVGKKRRTTKDILKKQSILQITVKIWYLLF